MQAYNSPSSSVKSFRASVAGYHQLHGKKWRSDWQDVPSLILATLLLAGWLAASLAVIIKEETLPLTFWDDQPSWGVFALGSGNYNTLIAVLGGLAGAGVCWGLSQGVKSVIRRRLVSGKGLAYRKYESMNKLATQSLQFKWRTSAILALALFALTNQFGAATQAAFGTSVIKYNVTVPYGAFRLVDNVGSVRTWLTSSANVNQVPYTGELTDFIQNAYVALLPDEDGIGGISVEGHLEIASAGGPVIPFQIFAGLLGLQTPTTFLNISDRDLSLIRGSMGTSDAFVRQEAYSTASSCRSFQPQYSSTALSGDYVQIVNTLPTCDASVRGVYDTSAVTIMDTAVCQSTSPDIYFFEISPATSSVEAAWVCTVNASAALYDTVYSQQADAGKAWGPAYDTQSLAFNQDLVAYTGHILWSTFGTQGSPDLNMCQAASAHFQLDFNSVLELVSSVTTSMVLAKLADTFVLQAITSPSPNDVTTSTTISCQVQALKLRLSGPQYAWISLPATLFVVVVVLAFCRLRAGHSGPMDPTDPCAMMLVAGGSPEEALWRGSSTGEFADNNATRGICVRYGVDVTNADRLVLVGNPDTIGRTPQHGEAFK